MFQQYHRAKCLSDNSSFYESPDSEISVGKSTFTLGNPACHLPKFNFSAPGKTNPKNLLPKSPEAQKVSRLSLTEMKEKLDNLQIERGFVTPVVEMLEHLFQLVGIADKKSFVKNCHPKDAELIWNTWKSRLFSLPGTVKKYDRSSFLADHAQFSLDRLLHFVKMYCMPQRSGEETPNLSASLSDDNKKAVLELFQAGAIEIPINRPKIFNFDISANRRFLRSFMVNNFRTDVEGQGRAVFRQKFPYFIHLFKTGIATDLTTEEIADVQTMLNSFQLDEKAQFSNDEIKFVHNILQVWMAKKSWQKFSPDVIELYRRTQLWLIQTALLNYRLSLGAREAAQVVARKYLPSLKGKELDFCPQLPTPEKSLEIKNSITSRTTIDISVQQSLSKFKQLNNALWSTQCMHTEGKFQIQFLLL